MRVHGIRDSFKIEANPVSEGKPRLLLAHYYPRMTGQYTVFVRWSGVHVPGSPFTVFIKGGIYLKPSHIKVGSFEMFLHECIFTLHSMLHIAKQVYLKSN